MESLLAVESFRDAHFLSHPQVEEGFSVVMSMPLTYPCFCNPSSVLVHLARLLGNPFFNLLLLPHWEKLFLFAFLQERSHSVIPYCSFLRLQRSVQEQFGISNVSWSITL